MNRSGFKTRAGAGKPQRMWRLNRMRPVFSLRSVFIVFSLACVAVAVVGRQWVEIRRHNLEVSTLVRSCSELGGTCGVYPQRRPFLVSWIPSFPEKMRLLSVYFSDPKTDQSVRVKIRHRLDVIQRLLEHPDITWIGLSNTDIHDEDMLELPISPSLKTLNLSNTAIGSSGLRWASSLPALRDLSLRDLTLDEEEVEWICQCQGLELLRMSSADLSDAAYTKLATHPGLRLLELSFSDGVCDRHVAALSSMQLSELSLGWTGITDDSVASLAKMHTLKHLNVEETYITKAGYDLLTAALPHTRIRWKLNLESSWPEHMRNTGCNAPR